MNETADDPQLIARFKQNDVSAFGEIVLRFQDKIYNLCRHMLGNAADAEDAAQDVFLKAYQVLPNSQPDSSLYTWPYRIAINTCIDHRRKPIFESLFGDYGEWERLIHEKAADLYATIEVRFWSSKLDDRHMSMKGGFV